MTTIIRTLLVAAWLYSTVQSFSQTLSPKPVDTEANSQTIALYDFLYQQYGSKTITCSMAQPVWDYDKAEAVKTLTGQLPAMHCFDLMHLCYSPCDWINYDDITPVKEWHDMGGKVVLMWHWQVPKSQGSNEYTATASETTFRPVNIDTEGSWEHQLFYTDLWEAYTVIKRLQDAGIAVIWRPLHEAAGNVPNGGEAWFWWGKDGADVFKGLWRRMFDYFQDLGIHNLIWTWTSCDEDGNWYPGDHQVDIIGTDIYSRNEVSVKSRFLRLQQRYPSKMITLSECGDVPQLSVMEADEVTWLWAMPWYGNNSQGNPWGSDAWWNDAVNTYASGISSILINPSESNKPFTTPIYQLDGRRASATPSPGIYIRNGKKWVIH